MSKLDKKEEARLERLILAGQVIATKEKKNELDLVIAKLKKEKTRIDSGMTENRSLLNNLINEVDSVKKEVAVEKVNIKKAKDEFAGQDGAARDLLKKAGDKLEAKRKDLEKQEKASAAAEQKQQTTFAKVQSARETLKSEVAELKQAFLSVLDKFSKD